MQHPKRHLIGFRSQKAAQIAVFFVGQCGGTTEKLKLAKLIYLAEREFISRYGQPMLYDELYSLPHGPICSSSLDGIRRGTGNKLWATFFDREGKNIILKKRIKRDDLDEVSDAELGVAKDVWESFGWMTSAQIWKYTHKHCPEYTEVTSGRLPISYKDVLTALRVPNASYLADRIDETRRIESIFSA